MGEAEVVIERDLVAALTDLRASARLALAPEIAELQAALRQNLEGDLGLTLLTCSSRIDEPTARGFVLAVSALVGQVMTQDARGSTLRAVTDRGLRMDDATARYSDTSLPIAPHTDGVQRPGPVPSIVGLHCVRPAKVGGAIVLVRARDVVARLRDRLDVHRVLRCPVRFDSAVVSSRPGDVVVRPVLIDDDGAVEVRYARDYIERGHCHPGAVPLSAEQRAAFDVLDDLLADPSLHRVHRLENGQLMLFDNHRYLHGRSSFTDGEAGHRRLVLRTWIAS